MSTNSPMQGGDGVKAWMHEWVAADSPQFDIDPEKITERLCQENDLLLKALRRLVAAEKATIQEIDSAKINELEEALEMAESALIP